MPSPHDSIQPSSGYAHDIRSLDAEPWKERGPVDELIELQQWAFQADRAGNSGEFGATVMNMSRVESAIGNHSEAAAYAGEAAEAFEQGGHTEEAVGARSTLAREHRTLFTPDLALASLHDVMKLRTTTPGERGQTGRQMDFAIHPVLRLVASFTMTYLSSSWTYHTAQDNEYPVPLLPPKSPRPSREASEELLSSFDEMLDIPVSMTGKEAAMMLLRLNMLYVHMSKRRLGLSKGARRTAETRASQLAALGFRVGLADPRALRAFEGNDLTLNEIMQHQQALSSGNRR